MKGQTRYEVGGAGAYGKKTRLWSFKLGKYFQIHEREYRAALKG